MAFPVIGGTQESGYNIDNSLRFNDDDSPEISFTLNKSPTHQDKGTWSFWIKRANIQSAVVRLYSGYADGGATQTWIRFDANDCLDVANRVGASFNTRLVTNRKFRDPSAWYHIVVAFDTTDGTSSNRAKVYVNSVQETSFSTETYPSQNDDLEGNTSGIQQSWGCDGVNNLEYFDGYFSDVYFIDGQQLAPTEFGETNDNGVWIPKRFSGSFGNNGYKLEFKQTGTSANSSGIGADTSGNDHHFTPTNLAATDVTTDTPTNNFATFNVLDNNTVAGNALFREGNLLINGNSTGSSGAPTNFAVSNGKWYVEGKCLSSTFEFGVFGYGNGSGFNITPDHLGNAYTIDYDYGGNIKNDRTIVQSGLATYTTNDILAIALDMDNNTIKFFKNGSQVGTTVTEANLGTKGPFAFYIATATSGNTDMFSLNTGNPAYTISSGNSDANGYGNFEYAVPSGYYALCTKNLAEYG